MLELIAATLTRLLPISVALFVGWVTYLYVYRLTLHPLAKFPGPKIAAATRWYEFYYDVVLKGQYVFHLQDLHKRYGPIIRISPDEIHINDPDFFETLYARSGRLHKHAQDAIRFGNPNSVFTTANADVHRVRRAALSPYFSRRSVATIEPFVRKKVDQMLQALASYRGTGKPVTISLGYMALAGDVVLEYTLGYNFNHVGSVDFRENFHELVLTATQSGNIAVHFPIIMTIIMSMPEWFVVWSTPLFALLFKLQKSVEKDVRTIKQRESRGGAKPESVRPDVITHLLRSDLPPVEKADKRLQDEAQNFVGAGVSTTGWALSIATYHIVKNRSIFHRLRKELEDAIPDPQAEDSLDWAKLEKCEYLTACIKESIRLAYAISGRSVRLSDNVIEYRQWHIPPKTRVGMTMVDLSHNEDIFPDSWDFVPDRWLGGVTTKTGEPVEKYWLGFMKGNRNCLGINLAWLEAYTALAGVFRSFDFELYETDDSDVVIKHDFMVPSPKLESKGIRVLVKG